MSLYLFLSDPIHINNPPLFELIDWRQTGDKPLAEPTMDYFTDACMRH